ncbi:MULTISPECIES: hypothetical protein [Salinibacter]|jgi:hypothetical protein|uniref:hypothetical protein n=1 Tax=Salinibacter TaxID=146918 RepID=UPI001ABB3265|nr:MULTISPECIES: hypothetical protein [Salinibacter]
MRPNREPTHTASSTARPGAIRSPSLGLVWALGLVGLLVGGACAGPNGEDAAPTLVTYEVGGEQDLYSDGDAYGHRVRIAFDRRYVLSRLVYRTTDDGYTLDTMEIGRDRLSPPGFDTLRVRVGALASDSIPARLPAVNPHDVSVRTPASSVVLKARPAPAADRVSVRANMGADREHYPSSFLRLHSALNRLLDSTMLPEASGS